MRHQGGRPLNIVICHDRNPSGNVVALERFANLQTFVRLVDLEDLDCRLMKVRYSQSLCHLLESFESVAGGHENELGRLASKNGLQRRRKLLEVVVDGRQDDCDILRRVSRLLRDRV